MIAPLVSQALAARQLGISAPSVVAALDRGDLDAKVVAGRRFVTLASVKRFAKKRAAIAKARAL